MLEQFLERSQYYEFPSFEVAIYSLLLAFVLAVILAVTYKATYRDEKLSLNFLQALVLSPLVSAMVMMAVGSNIAVGFGIIGAIAIIRFRTRVRNPRNVIFIFASLSIGIATGAYGYSIAIAGTLIFSTVAVLLHFSPYGIKKDDQFEVVFSLLEENGLTRFKEFIAQESGSFIIKRLREMPEASDRFEYIVYLKQGTDRVRFFNELKGIDGISDVRVEKIDYTDQL